MGGSFSENDVEVCGELPLVAAKEKPKLRIGYVVMDCSRIEMVGQVESADRESERVLIAHLEVFGYPGIKRVKGWVAV